MHKNPTQEIYSELQRAYEHFNQRLFQGELPPCLLTVQRKERRVMGYFSACRFVNPEGKQTDEIAMNPMHFESNVTSCKKVYYFFTGRSPRRKRGFGLLRHLRWRVALTGNG